MTAADTSFDRVELAASTPDEVALLSGFRAAPEDRRQAALAAVRS